MGPDVRRCGGHGGGLLSAVSSTKVRSLSVPSQVESSPVIEIHKTTEVTRLQQVRPPAIEEGTTEFWPEGGRTKKGQAEEEEERYALR